MSNLYTPEPLVRLLNSRGFVEIERVKDIAEDLSFYSTNNNSDSSELVIPLEDFLKELGVDL